MAKAKAKPATDAREVLENLSQADASWMIGRPGTWVRDNAHRFERKAGKYSARQLFSALATDFQPCELPDGLLERVRHLCDDVCDYAISKPGPAVELIESINQQHGAAGWAAVIAILLEQLREREAEGFEEYQPSAEEIRLRAEREIEKAADIKARREYKRVVVCTCGRYRWGKSWKPGPAPDGFAVVDEQTCDLCQAKLNRSRKPRRDPLEDDE